MTTATRTIPISGWPASDARAWRASSTVASWPKSYAARMARGYGRFLALMDGRTEIDPDAVRRFGDVLGELYAAATRVSYLADLYYALCVLRPDQDWAWIRPTGPKKKSGKAGKGGSGAVRARIVVPLAEWSPEHRERLEHWFSETPQRRIPTRRERKAQASAFGDGSSAPDGARNGKRTPSAKKHATLGWGRWLRFVRGTYGAEVPPNPDNINGFVAACESRNNSPVTIVTYLQELYCAAGIIFSDTDWTWLRADWIMVRDMAKPKRDKWAKFVPIDELCKLGVKLMLEAMNEIRTMQTARKYRDGYLIALLALRPKRASNIAQIIVGETLIVDAEGDPLSFSWLHTKNGDPSDIAFPAILVPFHRRWMNTFRPILLQGHSHDTLWVGRYGVPLTTGDIWRRIRHWTKARFQRAIGTHAFRMNYATSIAASEKFLVDHIPTMLDHRDPRSKAFYNLIGESFSAVATLDEANDALRAQARHTGRSKRRRTS